MLLSMKNVCTRFAPSPTGYLHIGGVRTALFSWLFAKQRNGTFILRIEDTDVVRSSKASVEGILESLRWLQIDWNEGPYYQSKRMDRYREVIEQLIKTNHAYRCYCSKERLIELRNTQLKNKKKPRYDGFCSNATPRNIDNPFVIRFRNPKKGKVVFNDIIHGTISVNNCELDDLIIVRSDGVPTYNLTVVVDDWDMNISHVIRGDDHINNTPRQINILHALGVGLPKYAHVPMILSANGKRLSKRYDAVSILQYRNEGYLPEALSNYLIRLGWAHGNQEIFSYKEMIQFFDISIVSRSPAVFNPKKLLWLNQHYLKTLSPKLVSKAFVAQLQKMGVDYRKGPPLQQVITLQAKRAKTLEEMVQYSLYFYQDIIIYKEKAALKYLQVTLVEPLQQVRDRLANLSIWRKETIYAVVIETVEVYQLKFIQLAQSIRVALTGDTISPPIDAILHLIGRDSVLKRLDQAINFIQENI